jgi:hypothetical protein
MRAMSRRDRLLAIYLNDHLAGATAGVELSKRVLAENRGTSFGAALEGLAGHIAEDRATLRALMDRLAVRVDPLKTSAAWSAEKMARLKLNGRIRGYSPLSRLVEIEALITGVEGKASLWRTLIQVAGTDREGRLDAVDLDGLLKRARTQQRRLERLRAEAAQVVFAGGAEGGPSG